MGKLFPFYKSVQFIWFLSFRLGDFLIYNEGYFVNII